MRLLLLMMFSLSILVQPLSAQEKEKLIMDGTAVIGNSEMPNVLYIVPWKKTPQPNLNPELHESLIESQLLPVDRNVFLKRIENHQRYQ